MKCYRSRLEAFAKDHPQYQGKGGLTKRAIQRLTVGAHIAVRMNSKDGNVQQLCHDLQNGHAHIFGDHGNCNPSFCKYQQKQHSQLSSHDDKEATSTNRESSSIAESLSLAADQIANIAAAELESQPTFEEETARSGHSASLSSLIYFAKSWHVEISLLH